MPDRIPGTTGQTITENAIDIDEYKPLDPTQRMITLKPDVEGVWTFAGWCSDETSTTPITEVNDVNADATVYGKWVYSEVHNTNEITFYYGKTYTVTVFSLDIDTLENLVELRYITVAEGETITVTASEFYEWESDYVLFNPEDTPKTFQIMEDVTIEY